MKKKDYSNISYIVPAFNAVPFLKRSVNSILINIEPNDDVVIVDDGSTDKTLEVANRLASKHPQIKVYSHPYNLGGGFARNTAVQRANNELIFCLDADNVLVEGSIKKLKECLISSGNDVASFQKIEFFKKTIKKTTHNWTFEKAEYTLEDVLSTPYVPGASGNYLFTKRSWQNVGGYPMDVKNLDAWGFGFRLAAHGYSTSVLPNSYYYHAYGHESYWIRGNKELSSSLRALQVIIPYLELLSPRDINYIFTKKRNNWFENIGSRKIGLKPNNSSKLQPFRKILNEKLYRKI